MPVKIAMIGQKGIPSRAGGVEIHVEEISKRLACLGYEVVVYCRRNYCDIEAKNNKYFGTILKFTPFINTKHLDAISHTFTSTIHALLSGCSIFHYHALGPSTLSFLPRIFGKKVVCTVHGLDWQRGKWGRTASAYLRFGEFATAKFSHKLISVSKNLVRYYKEKYDKAAVYIPNGVERPDMLKPLIIKEKYQLDYDEYILFLARIVPEKGAHYLIEAFKRLNTDKKLVIAGGLSHSSDYVQQLRELSGDNDNIIFTGFVRDRELAELYSNAYFYVLPSDIEGLPISLLEAMSYGNCCLVSNITENTDVVGTMGYSFEKSDINDLANKIEILIKDKNKVENVRKLASNYILHKYNWDRIAVETKNIYRSLSKNGPKKKRGFQNEGRIQNIN